MKTLREYIDLAIQNKKAIPHYNISTIDMLHAVVDGVAAVSDSISEKIPVVVGLAEKERDWMGEKTAVMTLRQLAQEVDRPIFINADHTYSVERACAAIDAGYDCVVIDFAAKTYEENVAATKQVVEYRNRVNPACLIEAELGFIGAGSQLRDAIPEGVSEATMTKPDEAAQFIADTGADMLAPSVGNVHGIVRGGEPALHAERVAEVVAAIPTTPLVLHGGSGSSNEDFLKVIAAGISMIHISTELRLAYHDTLKATLAESSEVAPYKYLEPAMKAVQKVVEDRTRLFWGVK